MTDLVVVSLEPWDEVWRRNQHLLVRMLRRDPALRVLFVEPPVDVLHALRRGEGYRHGAGLRVRDDVPGVGPDRLWTYQPTKQLPRRVDPRADARLADATVRAARALGFAEPVLWANDPAAASIMLRTGWPALYDITDDWAEAQRTPREHRRLRDDEHALITRCVEVVACSATLQRRKSAERPAGASPVRLIGNAVDIAAYRVPSERPAELPAGPVALYVGTVHADRIDVELCVATAEALRAAGGTLVLLGPLLLSEAETSRLRTAGAVLLGPRPHHAVPAYLQHAELLLVPHLVDAFTESLDPIKAYEYRAAGGPVLSTPVPGFADSGDPRVEIAEAAGFPAAAVRLIAGADEGAGAGADAGAAAPAEGPAVPDWEDRAEEIAEVVARTAAARTTATRAAAPAGAREPHSGGAPAAAFDGVILQAAPRIEVGAGVAGVAANLEREFAALGVPVERFTLAEAGGSWIPRPARGPFRRLTLALEVVWFSTAGGRRLRRLATGRTVVITHNDALAGDVYVNHGVLKASLKARGSSALRALRNPVLLFVLARDGWRYRSRLHREIVVLTPTEERTLREAYPRLRVPVTVIPNGVDIERFAPPEGDEGRAQRSRLRAQWGASDDSRVVLFVGHEYDRKGLPLILEALPRLPASVRLAVVGGSPELIRGAARSAEQLGVSDRVFFVGQVSDPAPCFRAADVFCLPSAYEANALVVLEALASGLPVVATRVGFAPDVIVDGENGLLVDRTADAVAEALGALAVAEPSAWRSAARATGERYSWSAAARRYLELAARLLAER